jgi:thiamine pyrophosphate-dependent acetolactate synthase large subunit-like protein
MAVCRLLAQRGPALVVSGLGGATYDVAAAGDTPRNFYLWGGMGGTAALALGLALARPGDPVICITGDGDMLMGLGSFATIAQKQPGNLSIVVLDNALFGETGRQPTHTAGPTDLAAVARACGIADARTVHSEGDLEAAAERACRLGEAPMVAILRIGAGEHPRVLPIRDGAHLKARFRLALGLTAD